MQTLRQMASVSVNINFGAKVSILCEKNWNLGRNVDFFVKCHYYCKWLSFCKIYLFLEKCDFLSEGLYKVSNSDKKLKFLRYIDFVYVLISIKVFHLLENCYYDSKCHFVQWYFGQESHFLSKIYITLGINSWEKLNNFLRKVLI